MLVRFILIVFCVLALLGPVPAHADATPFTKQFFKIKVFDPPLSITDIFFLQPKQQAPLQMSSLRGKWVILNVWATWCAPCMIELPKLDRLNAAAVSNGSNYAVLAVSVDQKMTADRLGYYLIRARAPGLAPLHDTVQVLSNKLDTGLLPVTYIVDPSGAVRVGLYGAAEWDSQQAVNFAQNLNKYVGP